MNQWMDDPRQIVLAGAIFGLVLSCFGILALLLWRGQKQREAHLEERLGLVDNQPERVLRLWHDGEAVTTIVPGFSRWRRLRAKLQRLPEDVGWTVPLRSVVMGMAGTIMLIFAICFALKQHPMLPVVLSLMLVVLFWVYTQHRISKRAAHFERQLVDALQLVARSLRAGHPLVGAFRLAAEEMDQPISRVFMDICQEQSLGSSLDDALRKAATGSGSSDMKLFATSIAIQLRSGGNLADMMDRLATVICDRIRLSQRVRIMTAQVQLSKRILLILPIFMLTLLSILNPTHMEALYTRTLGHYMLAGAAVSMLLGWIAMNRMTQLRY